MGKGGRPREKQRKRGRSSSASSVPLAAVRDQRYPCFYCGTRYSSKQAWNLHLVKNHPEHDREAGAGDEGVDDHNYEEEEEDDVVHDVLAGLPMVRLLRLPLKPPDSPLVSSVPPPSRLLIAEQLAGLLPSSLVLTRLHHTCSARQARSSTSQNTASSSLSSSSASSSSSAAAAAATPPAPSSCSSCSPHPLDPLGSVCGDDTLLLALARQKNGTTDEESNSLRHVFPPFILLGLSVPVSHLFTKAGTEWLFSCIRVSAREGGVPREVRGGVWQLRDAESDDEGETVHSAVQFVLARAEEKARAAARENVETGATDDSSRTGSGSGEDDSSGERVAGRKRRRGPSSVRTASTLADDAPTTQPWKKAQDDGSWINRQDMAPSDAVVSLLAVQCPQIPLVERDMGQESGPSTSQVPPPLHDPTDVSFAAQTGLHFLVHSVRTAFEGGPTWTMVSLSLSLYRSIALPLRALETLSFIPLVDGTTVIHATANSRGVSVACSTTMRPVERVSGTLSLSLRLDSRALASLLPIFVVTSGSFKKVRVVRGLRVLWGYEDHEVAYGVGRSS